MRLLVLLLSVLPVVTAVIDPLTWGIAFGGAVGIYAGYKALQCNFEECCDRKWITPDIKGMAENISTHVYGQHLVKDVIIRSITAHVRKSDPQKPLVLSFHGWTGGGKTFVSRIIANHLYTNGFDSKFVHFFSPTLNFPHARKVNEYKDNLLSWIKGNLSVCPQSLFIFDEMDKVPAGLVDVMKPYLDYHAHVDGVISKHAIFIFLSNTGGTDITNIVTDHWRRGGKREDIVLKSFNRALTINAFNDEGGFNRCGLIDSNLIDHFIPFLPLERRHVKLCILDDLRKRNLHHVPMSFVDKIADQLNYHPEDNPMFSKEGCKRIEKLIDYELEGSDV